MVIKQRIMHGLSEVSGQNSYSVMGLKEIGENADSVVYTAHPFGYPCDKSLNIDKANKMKYPLYVLKLGVFFFQALYRYSIFHFHFGHSILNCLELPLYHLFRKRIFFEFHGSDLRDLETFCKKSGMPYNPKNATSIRQHKRNAKICRAADGVIVHDDELIPYLPRQCRHVYVVPLRIDISHFEPIYPNPDNQNIRIVHAPSKREGKGTKYILEAFESIKKKYNNVDIVLVEGKTQQEAFEIYKTADIIIDQMFAGTYGVFAIECMAMGKPVITYISEDMKDRLPEELPIVSADINTVASSMELLINNGKMRNQKGREGRQYVENYHDYRTLAGILMDIYSGKTEPVTGRAAFKQVRDRKYGDC